MDLDWETTVFYIYTKLNNIKFCFIWELSFLWLFKDVLFNDLELLSCSDWGNWNNSQIHVVWFSKRQKRFTRKIPKAFQKHREHPQREKMLTSGRVTKKWLMANNGEVIFGYLTSNIGALCILETYIGNIVVWKHHLRLET